MRKDQCKLETAGRPSFSDGLFLPSHGQFVVTHLAIPAQSNLKCVDNTLSLSFTNFGRPEIWRAPAAATYDTCMKEGEARNDVIRNFNNRRKRSEPIVSDLGAY
jgi:hypothetical protein